MSKTAFLAIILILGLWAVQPLMGETELRVPGDPLITSSQNTASRYAVRGNAESTMGSVSGYISTSSGARLSGATVILERLATDRTYQVVSGNMGVFRASGLEEGSYRLLVELAGFKPALVPNVQVSPGPPQVISIKMEQAFLIEDHVTVIGTSSANSLEAAEIRESRAQDLGGALSNRSGISTVRKGGIANDLVLRGFQGRDVTVLIDGQRVYGACPNNMDPSIFHVDFAEVDRVDITKGPFDMKNQGGLGGSINVVTRRPGEGFHGRANLAAGSAGFINPSVDISYGTQRASLLGGYSFRRSSPYTDGSGRRFTELTNYSPDSVDSESYEVGTAWLKTGFNITENHQLQAAYTRQDASNVMYPYLRMDAAYDDTNRLMFRYDGKRLSDSIRNLSILGYYTDVSHWMTDELRTSSNMGGRGYSMGTMANTRTLGGKIETAVHRWTFGFEAYSRYWDAYTEMAGMNYMRQFSIPDVDIISLGVYAEYRKPLTEKLSLTTGFRADRVESTADGDKANSNLYLAYHGLDSLSQIDSFPSGSVRLDYEASQTIHLGFGFGSAVEVPEPSERYFALKRKGSDWVGNPELKRSRNNGIDAVISWRHPLLVLETGIFHNWVNDFITLYDQQKLTSMPGVMNTRARTYTNTDARFYGMDMNAVVPLEDRLFLEGTLGYVRGVKDILPEKGILSGNVAEIPPLNSRLGLRWDDGTVYGLLEGVFSARQKLVDLDLREEETPSWGIMNLQAGLRHERLTASLGLGNLFDRTYFEHLSYQRDPFASGVRVTEPGRNFFINLGIVF